MPKLIIALTGPIASGKDIAKDYISSKYKVSTLKYSAPLRAILEILRLPIDREHLQKLSLALLNNFGSDLLAKIISQQVAEAETEIVVIDGARRLEDVKYLKKLPQFKLIAVDTAIETRYQRLLGRTENEGDNKKTFAQFKAEEEVATETGISDLMAEADFILDNNSDLDGLYRQIDKIFAKIL